MLVEADLNCALPALYTVAATAALYNGEASTHLRTNNGAPGSAAAAAAATGHVIYHTESYSDLTQKLKATWLALDVSIVKSCLLYTSCLLAAPICG